VAAELAAALAQRGITVVSGLALGADAAAHEGCLRAGGRTIAVLGSGVDVIYPPEHVSLYARVTAAGAVLSEMPPGAPPSRVSFPIRNRIISGLALGVVVVEAPEKSGALITAAHALEQGREVFAVPGSVNSVQSRGSHQLLKDGAKLVSSVEDILEEIALQVVPQRRELPRSGPNWDAVLPEPAEEQLGSDGASPSRRAEHFGSDGASPSPPPAPRPRKPAPSTPAKQHAGTGEASPSPRPVLTPEEETLLQLLTTTARHVDELIEASRLSPAQVNSSLLLLELKGCIQRRPGNQYVRLV
jgi:DNA processing protein